MENLAFFFNPSLNKETKKRCCLARGKWALTALGSQTYRQQGTALMTHISPYLLVALSELHPLVTIIIDSCVVAPIISSVQVYHLFCGTKSQLTNESNIG